tara:strand:+ start:372 stop:1067 length:696 start_codon:yes stop_codon:yes gene_type:complete
MTRSSKTALFTKLNICNQALSLIGSERVQVTDAELTSPTSNSIAQQADLHYNPAIQELSRMHNWHCGLVREDLVPVSSGTGVDDNHVYSESYVAPATAQRIIRVGTDTSTSIQPKHDFSILSDEGDTNGEKTSLTIQTDLASAKVLYVAAPVEASMDAMFAGCLRTYLASKLAIPVAGDVNRKFELLKYLYEIQLPEAKRANALEGTRDFVNDSFEETPLNPFTYKPIIKR